MSRAQLFTGSPWRAPERQAHHYGRAPVTEAVAQRGVRVRAAVAAVLVLAAPLTLAAGALLWLLQSSLQSSAEDAASARAAQIALHLLSDPLPEIDPTVLATNGRTTVIQVLDTAGRVVASSAGAPTTPLVTVHPTAGTQLSVEPQQPKVTYRALDLRCGELVWLCCASSSVHTAAWAT